jgi:WD40 repeat protein
MGHSSPVNTILLNSDEAELYSGLKGGMIVLWDIYNQKVKINLQGHSTLITSMSIYRNNNIPCVLASASADGKIKLWDLKSKSAATNFKGHFSQIDSLCFSPDFTYLASGAQDGVVKIWDIRLTNKSLKEISDKEQKSINCIEFNNYEMAFAFGGKDKMIRYYNIEKFNKIGQTSADRLPIQKIAFDNEGKNLFSATDESLKYWEIHERGLSLADMYETGWNKLQSFKYIEGKAVCALSSFGNKISYYLIKYKDLFKAPNILLRENPNMGNIFEVQENEDSMFLEKNKNVKNGSGQEERSFEINRDKNNKSISNNINNNNNNNNNSNALGISKFINDITNVSSLTDISTSKIENESLFVKSAINMIGKNNYNGPIVPSNKNKILNPDDIPLPVQKNVKTENKELGNNNNENEDEEKNPIEEQVEKLMIGDISNMSDISDLNASENKGDLTLGIIFGNHKNMNEINNEKKIKENDKLINNKIENDDFKEFGEKEVDDFFGKSSQNKNLDISAIQSFANENEGTFFDIPMNVSISKKIAKTENNNAKGEKNQNSSKMTLDELNSLSFNNKDNNKSFASLKSNETLGIDFTEFIEENGMLNEVKKPVPQSQDLPILQEINSIHDNMRCVITKRYNGLKIVTDRWKNSDIPSTLNALQILKDDSVIKDFFYYAIISREDIARIPLTLDSAAIMLPYVNILMKSKIDVYWKTACRAGMTFLKIFTEKIENTKMNKRNAPVMQVDPILDERNKKCDALIKIFKQIYESSHLKRHIKIGDNDENNIAYTFFNDLQSFLKSFDDNNRTVFNNA